MSNNRITERNIGPITLAKRLRVVSNNRITEPSCPQRPTHTRLRVVSNNRITERILSVSYKKSPLLKIDTFFAEMLYNLQHLSSISIWFLDLAYNYLFFFLKNISFHKNNPTKWWDYFYLLANS